MTLLLLGCAWIAGIFLGSLIDIGSPFVFLGLLPFLFIPLLRRYKKTVILTGLCLVALLAGAWHYGNSLPDDDGSHLLSYNDSGIVQIRGTVERFPEQKGDLCRFHLAAEAIRTEAGWQDIHGTALVFTPHFITCDYGDTLLVKGETQTPVAFDDFDYEQYLAIKGIYTTIRYPEIEVIDTGQGNPVLGWLNTFRNRISDSIIERLPEPQASFTQGILLGMRGSIPEDVTETFSITGTSHLLAISGLHLSIIAGLFITLGIRLFGRQRYIYIWLALGVVWLYAALTGMNPPVIRAAIMITVYLAAELFGRQKNSITALVFAAAVMVGITPTILQDASFQLSFAAMAGLIFIFPTIQAGCRKLIDATVKNDGIPAALLTTVADSLSVSLGAILAVWPLVAYYFGTLSPLAPVVSLFTIPVLPVAIFSGIVCGVSALIWLPLAHFFGWFAWLASSFILLVVELFSHVPSLNMDSIGIIPIVIYYLLLAIVLWFVKKKLNKDDTDILVPEPLSFGKTGILIVSLLTAAVFSIIVAFSIPDKDLHTVFLDVGQGDAILLQKGSRQILIDGGPSTDAVLQELGKKMPFWDRTIDLVILTHPDADHLTGLIEVLGRYNVDTVLYPDVVSNSLLFAEFKTILQENDIDAMTVRAGGSVIFADGIILDILNPGSGKSCNDIDNDSIVLNLRSGDYSFLLTGDIMKETEIELISGRAVSRCTILKIAHHGSAAASSQEFLNVTRPHIAVVCCGENNRFGHPVPAVIERLENLGTTIYRTDISGTIEFITDGTSLKIITSR